MSPDSKAANTFLSVKLVFLEEKTTF